MVILQETMETLEFLQLMPQEDLLVIGLRVLGQGDETVRVSQRSPLRVQPGKIDPQFLMPRIEIPEP